MPFPSKTETGLPEVIFSFPNVYLPSVALPMTGLPYGHRCALPQKVASLPFPPLPPCALLPLGPNTPFPPSAWLTDDLPSMTRSYTFFSDTLQD